MVCGNTKGFFDGKVVLITGGASGIGKEIAFTLAGKGCTVLIVDIASAENTAKELILTNPEVNVQSYKADISRYEEIVSLKQKIDDDGLNVDIVINNAAILFEKPLFEESSEQLTRIMEVNMLGALWLTKIFLPGMIERKRGHIVSMSSIAGLYAPPQMLMYTTTKFAIRGFMEALQADLYVQGHAKYIKMTTIYPYFVNSSKASVAFTDDFWQLPKLFQPIEVDGVAKRIVSAIKNGEKHVTIPWFHKFMGYYFNAAPWLRNWALSKGVKKQTKTNIQSYNNNNTKPS